jgi:hypothetical protein
MSRIAAFVRFWIDFVIGDDWRTAAGIAVGIAATALLADDHVAAWWLLPVTVVAVLWLYLRRATRASETK